MSNSRANEPVRVVASSSTLERAPVSFSVADNLELPTSFDSSLLKPLVVHDPVLGKFADEFRKLQDVC